MNIAARQKLEGKRELYGGLGETQIPFGNDNQETIALFEIPFGNDNQETIALFVIPEGNLRLMLSCRAGALPRLG